jgi:hypothetical protein
MAFSLKRKPVGTGPNTLKKKSTIAVGETTGYDEQPWATAHLQQNKYNMPTSETATMPHQTPSKPSNSQENEQFTLNAAEDSDAITPLPQRQSKIYIDPIAGHSNVTIPARPPRKHTYSELFDLDDLVPGFQVRSPSGNMLSADQVAARADRPVGIKERQEIIRRRVAEQREKELGNEVFVVGDAEGKERRDREKGEEEGEGFMAKVGAILRCGCQ